LIPRFSNIHKSSLYNSIHAEDVVNSSVASDQIERKLALTKDFMETASGEMGKRESMIPLILLNSSSQYLNHLHPPSEPNGPPDQQQHLHQASIKRKNN
jgi:hypothetical protein